MWRSTRRYSIGITLLSVGKLLTAFEALDYLVSSILVFERDDVLEAKDLSTPRPACPRAMPSTLPS